MILLSAPQIAFIVASIIVLVVIVFLLIFLPAFKKYKKKNYREYYYQEIKSLAFNEDYYLINDFKFKIGNNTVGTIDHILFADKYIYLIISEHFSGDLMGKLFDESLIVVEKGSKKYVANPVNDIKLLLERLVIKTEQDPGLFIGIVLVNDDINISVTNENKIYYIIQRKKFKKLIEAIESRDIPTLNEKDLDLAVKAFDNINLRDNNG